MLAILSSLMVVAAMALYMSSEYWLAGSRSSWLTHQYSSYVSTPSVNITTTVNVGYSIYQDILLEGGVNQFLGMRYAAPPIGNRRWRAPQEPLFNRTVQSARNFGDTCLGLAGPGLSDTVTEDCLFLDVFAPANITTDAKLPVWFFIQGGGYAGNLDNDFNATEVVMRSNHSLVFVQINYRVGAFGFLASDKVRDDNDLNVGLLDQRFALYWARKYIYLFGGDKDHVVIHGDSAGGESVAYHLTAYGGQDDGLFVGAVAESPFWPTHRTVAEMEFQFGNFSKSVSCAVGDVMACLRSKDTKTLERADLNLPFPNTTGAGTRFFLPVVDGTFSTDSLYNLFEQDKALHVPLIVGDDSDEGTLFAPDATTEREFLDFIEDNFPRLSDDDLERISEQYP